SSPLIVTILESSRSCLSPRIRFNASTNSASCFSLPSFSHGDETTRSQPSGASSRRNSAKRVNDPFFLAIECIARRSLSISIIKHPKDFLLPRSYLLHLALLRFLFCGICSQDSNARERTTP